MYPCVRRAKAVALGRGPDPCLASANTGDEYQLGGLVTSVLSGAAAPPMDLARHGRRRRGRKLVSYVLTMWFLLTLNFALPRAMPGNPIEAMLAGSGAAREVSEQERAAAARYYGLDRPLWEQYRHYMGGLARGDLGTSIHFNRPVSAVLADRLPWTLLLGVTSVAVATAAGVAAGVYSGWRRGGRADRILVALFTAGRGVPPFFLASVAVFVFAVKLRWVPLFGATTPFKTYGPVAGALDVAHHLVLPASVAALLFAGGSYLITRAGMVSELGADYLLLGRAKGMPERRLQYAYAFRNALLPLVSLTALELGAVVSAGLIFIERVFAYPGVGQLLFESIQFRDYPALQGCYLLVTVGVVSMNYLADALVSRLDPRTAV